MFNYDQRYSRFTQLKHPSFSYWKKPASNIDQHYDAVLIVNWSIFRKKR